MISVTFEQSPEDVGASQWQPLSNMEHPLRSCRHKFQRTVQYVQNFVLLLELPTCSSPVIFLISAMCHSSDLRKTLARICGNRHQPWKISCHHLPFVISWIIHNFACSFHPPFRVVPFRCFIFHIIPTSTARYEWRRKIRSRNLQPYEVAIEVGHVSDSQFGQGTRVARKFNVFCLRYSCVRYDSCL